MAENKAEISPEEIKDSGEYSPIPSASAAEKPMDEELETVREPKRRKNCPTALDKFEELTPSNRAFSFSFDTKIAANSAEFTPKFGSFNFGLAEAEDATTTPDSDRLRKIPVTKDGAEEEAEGEEEIEVSNERDGVGLLGLVGSIKGID